MKMQLQFPTLNAFKTETLKSSFKNVSDKIIRIKNQATDNFRNIDLKYALDTQKLPKLFAATVITAGLGGIALLSQSQNTPISTSFNSTSSNTSENLNTSDNRIVNSSTLEAIDENFSTGKILFSVLGLVAIVVGGILFCNEYEFQWDTKPAPQAPELLKTNFPHKVAAIDEKFVRNSQIRALSKLFNGFKWNSNFQANEIATTQLINARLEAFQNIKISDLEILSNDDFKVWEENFIKLLTLICYEKNQVRNSYEMNETFFQFIKRLYNHFLEIEFENTNYAGSTRKKVSQEQSEQKNDSLDFDPLVTHVQSIQDDHQLISIKVEILTAMLHSKSLALVTVRSLLRPQTNKFHDQFPAFQQIEKDIQDLEQDMSDFELSKFPHIERRSLELLSDINCTKQFNLNHYSREDWRSQDIGNVEKLYKENLELAFKKNFSPPPPLEVQKRYSEFSALRQYFYDFYSKSIYLSLKLTPSYFQQCERLENLKSKVDNYFYVLNLNDEELLQLKIDLINQHLKLNLETGLFEEITVEQTVINEILTKLAISALTHQRSLFPPKQEIEEVSSPQSSISTTEKPCSRHCLDDNKSGENEKSPLLESGNLASYENSLPYESGISALAPPLQKNLLMA